MVVEVIICFIATVGFGIIFNVPGRAVLIGGAIGSLSWFILKTLPQLGASSILATAIAAFTAATISRFLAKPFRFPGTVFSIPGIIPLVPGSKAYFTMLAFVEGNYLLGLEQGIETMLQAGAIAAGLVFSLSMFSFGKGGIGQRYETKRT